MFGFGCHTVENTYTFVGTKKEKEHTVSHFS